MIKRVIHLLCASALLLGSFSNICAQSVCHALFSVDQDPNTLEISFSDSSSTHYAVTSWIWDFGDGNSSTSQNPSHTYAHGGAYDVCLIVYDAHGCSDSVCQQIIVHQVNTPTCQASFSFHEAANGLQVNFADASTGSNIITSWVWDFGDGNSSTLQNPSHTYAHGAPYDVCLIIHDAHGCSDSVCQQIILHQLNTPACHASFSFQEPANGLQVNFSDASTGSNTITSWVWDFGDGNSSTLQNPSHSYSHEGTYDVCLIIHDVHGCSDSVCQSIVIYAGTAPVCHAAFTASVGTNGETFFTNTSTGTGLHTSYYWTFGEGTGSSDENPHFTFSHSGHFTVCLHIVDSLTGCSSQKCRQVANYNTTHHHALVPHFPNIHMQPNDNHSKHEGFILHHPNPFSTYTTLKYELAYDASVIMDVYDMQGNKIRELINEQQSEGEHLQQVYATGLNSGFYFIKMMVDGQFFLTTINVIK
jgi:PKD repeat protein